MPWECIARLVTRKRELIRNMAVRTTLASEVAPRRKAMGKAIMENERVIIHSLY